jgi:hypothetical protein
VSTHGRTWAGGQIRNVVLTATLIALEAARPIQPADVFKALTHERRKMGREPPAELRSAAPSGQRDRHASRRNRS